MVLHHVAHGPGLVVVGAAVFHAEGLVDADLHVLDVRGAPQRLEQRVGEAQRHQVLHRFLAQVVVDAEHPRLVEHLADHLVDRPRRLQRMAERLFQHDAGFRPRQTGQREVLRDGREQRRGGRQVVHQHPALAAFQGAAQAVEIGALPGVHGEVGDARGEAAPGLQGEVGLRHLRPAMPLGEGEEGVVVHAPPGQGENPRIGWQAVLAMQVVERRKQLAQGQVAGAAEHQDVAGTGQCVAWRDGHGRLRRLSLGETGCFVV
ncbi:hypothetical protein FQZ97_803300 [compost metagenome]